MGDVKQPICKFSRLLFPFLIDSEVELRSSLCAEANTVNLRANSKAKYKCPVMLKRSFLKLKNPKNQGCEILLIRSTLPVNYLITKMMLNPKTF